MRIIIPVALAFALAGCGTVKDALEPLRRAVAPYVEAPERCAENADSRCTAARVAEDGA